MFSVLKMRLSARIMLYNITWLILQDISKKSPRLYRKRFLENTALFIISKDG